MPEKRSFIQENGVVMLVDPNDINVNPDQINAIPDYENMHLLVELSARRRGRSIIMSGGGQIETDGDSQISVNLMGVSQDKDDPNYGSFTTNWHDMDSGDGGQSETFGITRIDIKTNTSFIPQVNIEFTDIRGYSFFNNENSPYRIIFDFPPPVFTLKVKGYYGKTLTYLLHLVKYTSAFNSDTGNYVINADFVALTYAPLADVLFRYAVNLPLSDDSYIYTSSVSVRPVNTFDFILKLKSLYNEIDAFRDTVSESLEFDESVKNLNNFTNAKMRLNNFKEDVNLNRHGEAFLFIITGEEIEPKTTIDSGGVETIQTFDHYDRILQSFDEVKPSNINKRLYIGFYYKKIESRLNLPNLNVDSIGSKVQAFLNNSFRDVSVLAPIASSNIIRINHDLKKNIETEDEIEYGVVDITNSYVEFHQEWERYRRMRSDAADVMNEKINELILTELGMYPTIYNVFELIMDDVDYFFRRLWDTSRKAEESHNSKFKNLFINNPLYKDSDDYIYAFPLIIKKEPGQCGEEIEVRSSPIDLERELGYNFPELDLVDAFVESFMRQSRLTSLMQLREEKDDDGQNLWIPITTLDSRILASSNSPYAFIHRNPTSLIYRIILERFYILTQYALANNLYYAIENSVIDLYAEGEAINLSLSVKDSNIANLIKEQARRFSNNPDSFYTYLSQDNDILDLYDFDMGFVESLRLSHRDSVGVFKNKNNENFIGLNIYRGDVQTKGSGDLGESNNLISKFINESAPERKWYQFRRRASEGHSEIVSLFNQTTENLFYLDDLDPDDDFTSYYYISKKRVSPKLEGDELVLTTQTRGGIRENYNEMINFLKNRGNLGLVEKGFEKMGTKISDVVPNKRDYFTLPTILMVYSFQIKHLLDINKRDVYDTLFNPSSEMYDGDLSSLMMVSLFGNMISPFNNAYNRTIFSIPMVAHVPNILVYYLGCLVYFSEDEDRQNKLFDFLNSDLSRDLWDKKNVNRQINYFEQHMFTGGFRIVADLYDVANHLSINDKETLKNFYLVYRNNLENGILTFLRRIISNPESIEDDFNRRSRIRGGGIESYTPRGDDLRILRRYTDRFHLLVHSDRTFYNGDSIVENEYFSLQDIVVNNKSEGEFNRNVVDSYFKTLFSKLNDNIDIDDLEKEEREYQERINDDDIRTQTYYSFKNINDKWLSGIDGVIDGINTNGYPFSIHDGINREGGQQRRLINSFAFVDRTMSPIGDTIIDPEILLNILDSPDTTIFTAISQILSTNGFEFFPLQNFMSHNPKDWVDSFKLDVTGESNFQPIFVCMYIGGASSYPTGINRSSGGQFKDDGIVDLSSPGVDDFSISDCNRMETPYDRQLQTNLNFPYRQVRAFRVRFGEQNQSMFFDIKIEGNEFPETNESIQILSRIAGDNKQQAPIPKGQNLYNMYENRAYSSTISTLGNMMIQPSQYYQLENIPMFDGAYIILNVEHNITPNFMTTKFEGTKILKYPIPRVKNPFAVFGYEGGTSEIGEGGLRETIPTVPDEFIDGPYMSNPLTPNPLIIRRDTGGDGRWLARRGRNGKHQGIDFATTIGQEIKAPISGTVTNVLSRTGSIPMLTLTPSSEDARPEYFDRVEILYVLPPSGVNYNQRRNVKRGDVIGIQMDLRELGYSDRVGPHIHLQLRTKKDFRVNPRGFLPIEGEQSEGNLSYLLPNS